MNQLISEIKHTYSKWGMHMPACIKGARMNDKKMTAALLRELDLSDQERAQIVSLPLLSVNGIGTVKAVELWKQGVRPGNLERHRRLLPAITLLEMKYHPVRPIPRETVERVWSAFIPRDQQARTTIAGSYRRLKPTSNDVDIVYTGTAFEALLDRLTREHGDRFIIMSRGPSTVLGLFILDNKCYEVDLWVAKPEARAAMILYATGSAQHNIFMRLIAKRQGLKLSQYGLFDATGKLVPTRTERDIYRAVGIKYRAPEDR